MMIGQFGWEKIDFIGMRKHLPHTASYNIAILLNGRECYSVNYSKCSKAFGRQRRYNDRGSSRVVQMSTAEFTTPRCLIRN